MPLLSGMLPLTSSDLLKILSNDRSQSPASPRSQDVAFCLLSFACSSWWRMTGSNRRPSACKADALPAELIPLLPVAHAAGCVARCSLPRRTTCTVSVAVLRAPCHPHCSRRQTLLRVPLTRRAVLASSPYHMYCLGRCAPCASPTASFATANPATHAVGCVARRLALRLLLVGLVGLEPTTPALSTRCSNQLSYRPVTQ